MGQESTIFFFRFDKKNMKKIIMLKTFEHNWKHRQAEQQGEMTPGLKSSEAQNIIWVIFWFLFFM